MNDNIVLRFSVCGERFVVLRFGSVIGGYASESRVENHLREVGVGVVFFAVFHVVQSQTVEITGKPRVRVAVEHAR